MVLIVIADRYVNKNNNETDKFINTKLTDFYYKARSTEITYFCI